MHSEQLQSVLLLKLPFLLNELVLLAFFLNLCVLSQQLLILRLTLRENALVDEFFNIFVDVEGMHHFS